MRMTETQTEEIQKTTDIICDVCGRSCIGSICGKEKNGNFCGIHFSCSGGYDSPVFPDDESSHEFDVCEYCVEEWMKNWPNYKNIKLLNYATNTTCRQSAK